MSAAVGFAAFDPASPLREHKFVRRDPRADDVQIEILYCGVCHSDLHTVRSEWSGTQYPCIPGHEIVGRVTKVGSEVTRYKIGDLVGVGCMVDSCRTCSQCKEG
ncbi:MAG TPA: alcohol dehydrogenase catalytic domain-containing protein, partial [Nevskiaceae bacterium]|nr:alcohol dehydrogenase catalytic domain-containing protein [Nevskiaceae bacterium]